MVRGGGVQRQAGRGRLAGGPQLALQTLRRDGTLAKYSTADVYGIDLTKAPPAGARVIGGRQ